MVAGSPIWPRGLIARPDREHDVTGLDPTPVVKLSRDAAMVGQTRQSATSDVEILKTEVLSHLMAMRVEECEAGPLEGGDEKTGDPFLALACEALKGKWIGVEVVNRG